jgi:hypothetical protein
VKVSFFFFFETSDFIIFLKLSLECFLIFI